MASVEDTETPLSGSAEGQADRGTEVEGAAVAIQRYRHRWIERSSGGGHGSFELGTTGRQHRGVTGAGTQGSRRGSHDDGVVEPAGVG